MDPVDLQPDAQPAVEPTVDLPDHAGDIRPAAVTRNRVGKRISCQPPAIIPASSQQTSRTGSRRPGKAAGGHPGHRQKGNTEQTTEAGQPGRRGKRTARPQGQKNAGGHGADMGKDPPFRDQANDGFLLAFPTAFA